MSASLARQSMGVFSAQVLLRVVALVLSVVLARSLGPAGKGAYALVLSVPFMLALFGGFGLGSAHVFFLGKKRYTVEEVAGNSLIVSVAGGLTFVGIFVLAQDWFASQILIDIDPQLVVLALATVPMLISVDYSRNILLATGQITQFNILGAIDEVLLLLFVLCWLLVAQIGLAQVIAVKVAAVMVRSVLGLIYVRKQTASRLRLNIILLKQAFSFGLRVYFANVMQFFNYRLDLFIVGYFIGLAGTGQYSVAAGLAGVVWLIPQSIGVALLPKVSSSTDEEADRSTPTVCRQAVFVTLIVALVLAAVGQYVIAFLFGPRFSPAVVPFLLLLPGTVAFAVPKVINSDLVGRGRPAISTFCAGISLVVTVALDLLLIPKWGISGAAVASSAAYGVYAVVMVISYVFVSGATVSELLIPRAADFHAYRRLASDTLTAAAGRLGVTRAPGIGEGRE